MEEHLGSLCESLGAIPSIAETKTNTHKDV